MHPATKVIGIGSHHGDDLAGWLVAERLRRRADIAAEVISLRDTTTLIDHLDGCQRLILIDACLSGDIPGTVKRLEWPAATLESHGGASTHGLTVADALELAERLERLPRDVVLLVIEAEHASPGESANATTLAGLDQLEAQVLAELARPPDV
jgi:hydrogenase maturation protease